MYFYHNTEIRKFLLSPKNFIILILLFSLAFYTSCVVTKKLSYRYKVLQNRINLLKENEKKLHFILKSQNNNFGFTTLISAVSPNFLQRHSVENESNKKIIEKWIKELQLQQRALNAFCKTIPGAIPLKGELIITSPFGARVDPAKNIVAFHSGVDLFASIGTPIKATGNGIVSETYFDKQYGYLVVIKHPYGYKSLYAHMAHFSSYKVGQQVLQGQTVGYVGVSGRTFGAHLHYEIFYNGFYQNPIPYLFLLKSLSLK